MAPALAVIVEGKDLMETVLASVVVGVGVTFTFSLMIFGAARSADMRREERPVLATAAGAVAIVSGLVTVAAIVLGMFVMLNK